MRKRTLTSAEAHKKKIERNRQTFDSLSPVPFYQLVILDQARMFLPFRGEVLVLFENVFGWMLVDGPEIFQSFHFPRVLVQLIEEYSSLVLQEPVFELLIPFALARHCFSHPVYDYSAEPYLDALCGDQGKNTVDRFGETWGKPPVGTIVFKQPGEKPWFSLLPGFNPRIELWKLQDPTPRLRRVGNLGCLRQVEFEQGTLMVARELRALWLRINVHSAALVRLSICAAQQRQT